MLLVLKSYHHSDLFGALNQRSLRHRPTLPGVYTLQTAVSNHQRKLLFSTTRTVKVGWESAALDVITPLIMHFPRTGSLSC